MTSSTFDSLRRPGYLRTEYPNSGVDPEKHDRLRSLTEREDDANQFAREVCGLDESGAHNGDWDAFRHAFVSAGFARDFGEIVSLTAGAGYELRGIGDALISGRTPAWNETRMDMFNNRQGVRMGSNASGLGDKQLAERVCKQLRDHGLLILEPSSKPGQKPEYRPSNTRTESGSLQRDRSPRAGDYDRIDLPADTRYDRWDRPGGPDWDYA